MRDPEMELENEYEYELENLSEPFLGRSDGEFEGFGDGEGAFGEGPLGELEDESAFGESLGEISLGEFDSLGEMEDEYGLAGEGEYEDELFFGGLKKLAGLAAPLLKKAMPMLKKVASVAAPLVGTAIGGPLGGALGSFAAKALGQSEYEGEFEFELEGESEAEMEAVMEGPLTEQQVLGELMAAAASRAQSDMEAEAQIGSATAIVLSRSDLAALRSVLPNINRGVAVLTRILRRRSDTREGIRAIPTIVKRSVVSLRKQAASGRPVTRKSAARAMATQTRRVLGTPSICAKALQRNARATQTATGKQRRPQDPRRRYAI